MPKKKGAAAPEPAAKAKPTEDQLQKARIEKEKQDKLAKIKELDESGSGLIDIARIYKIPPQQAPSRLLHMNVKMRTTQETPALRKKQTRTKKQQEKIVQGKNQHFLL